VSPTCAQMWGRCTGYAAADGPPQDALRLSAGQARELAARDLLGFPSPLERRRIGVGDLYQ
jgi:hypothetical protein